jgi:hypothetical protein
MKMIGAIIALNPLLQQGVPIAKVQKVEIVHAMCDNQS